MYQWNVDQSEYRESVITAVRGLLHLLFKDDRYNFMEATLQLVFPRSFCCRAVNLSVLEGSKDSPEAKGQNSGEQGRRRGEDEIVR